MRVVAIVQARTSSTRLPRKVLLEIAGIPMLTWTLTRLQRATRLDEVIVATTTDDADEAVARIAEAQGLRVWRGSRDNVLLRYAEAAEMADADVVVRVTSDCPFIDPEIVDEALSAWASDSLDYFSTAGFPRGLDVEVMSRAALRRAVLDATLEHERAHVTPYLYQNPATFRLGALTNPVDMSEHRWCVDTMEDLEFAREVARRLGPHPSFGWREILELVETHPELTRINAMIRQKTLEEC